MKAFYSYIVLLICACSLDYSHTGTEHILVKLTSRDTESVINVHSTPGSLSSTTLPITLEQKYHEDHFILDTYIEIQALELDMAIEIKVYHNGKLKYDNTVFIQKQNEEKTNTFYLMVEE